MRTIIIMGNVKTRFRLKFFSLLRCRFLKSTLYINLLLIRIASFAFFSSRNPSLLFICYGHYSISQSLNLTPLPCVPPSLREGGSERERGGRSPPRSPLLFPLPQIWGRGSGGGGKIVKVNYQTLSNFKVRKMSE